MSTTDARWGPGVNWLPTQFGEVEGHVARAIEDGRRFMAGARLGTPEEIVALDDALNQLATLDVRKVRVVEMKFFGGLTFEEIAGVLKTSPVTVKRDWSFARTWLLRELGRAE